MASSSAGPNASESSALLNGVDPRRPRCPRRPWTTVAAVLLAMLVTALGLALWSRPRQLPRSLPMKAQDGGDETFPGHADLLRDGLPGQPGSYQSRLFSGYLPVGSGGEAFYFFAESQSPQPLRDPLILWLNGGPGGSSLSGCFSEIGPLLVRDDGQSLVANPFAWNAQANLLCIESPIGVGFSYNASGVYVSDDWAQAVDLHEAMQQFLARFPWLRENDLILAGESYGGVYVPLLAKRILEANRQENTTSMQLKKFAIGNGVNEFSKLSNVLVAYYHGIIGTDVYQDVRTSCPELQERQSDRQGSASTANAPWVE